MKSMSSLTEKMESFHRNGKVQPGEITLCMHELWDRHKEVPNTDDCYLVAVWTDHITKEEGQNPDADCLPPVPFLASKIDALSSARSRRDKEDWHWAWDGTEKDNRVRFQGNSTTIQHPIYLTFQWGGGHPKSKGGATMLPHQVPGKYQKYCRHCGTEVGSVPKDCPTLRLRALAKAHGEEVATHLDALKEWHSKSRPLER